MRQLLCTGADCGAKHTPGRRQSFAAAWPDPAEWERVVRGRAKIPDALQRTAHVNGTPVPLPPGQFECDFCGGAIMPGDEAVAYTAWQPSRQQEPYFWEVEYLDDPHPNEAELAADARTIIEQEPRP